MQVTGKLTTARMNFESGKVDVQLELNTDNIEVLNELNGEKINIELKKPSKHRSLNSNNYAWHLISEIADKMRMDKEDVYFQMLKSYGKSDMISVLSEIDISKFIKYYEKAGETILNGKDFTHYKVYTGTSEYDNKQMSIFIDGVVQEAKNLGIETLTPDELSMLKDEWK